MILILAIACGVAVANIYFPQAVSPLIAAGLGLPPDGAALVVTAAQLGYAAGLFLLVPLGDRVPHRRLIVTLLVLTGAGLLVAGFAPGLPMLVAASAAVGVTTVVPQIIIPVAAGLAGDERRGAVTGTLLSGLIGGILLARTFGGTLGEWLGWRAPYWVAAAMALTLAAVLRAALPHQRAKPEQDRHPRSPAEPEQGRHPRSHAEPEQGRHPQSHAQPEQGRHPQSHTEPEQGRHPQSHTEPEQGRHPQSHTEPEQGRRPRSPVSGGQRWHPRLLVEPVRLLLDEPELRRSCLYQAMMFGGFSAAWTSLALLVTGPVYGLGAQAVGLIALVGAGSMVSAPMAGRWVDRGGPDRVNLVCLLGAVAAAAVLLIGARGGATGLVGLGAGMLLLDVAMQSGQVANQARIFALRPEARGRLNTAYMTCSFAGGSAGSWLGVQAYTHLGWPGVCALVAIAAGIALLRWWRRSPSSPRPRPAAARRRPDRPRAAGR
ncbi:MFS transporter [Nonomuraea sediminis]|uniref:MFS transporter n=1 Tax=Nonomuraea sediminis TaxID=2835864 RepID=UPI001BDBBB9D|nr:MFS transporter [Nonomuraea sediminis]